MDSLRLNAEIPDLHRPGVRVDPDSAARVPVKTHYAWSGQHPMAEDPAGAVYILRHPKDVLLSFLAYRKLNRVLPPDDPEIDRRYALMFCKGLGDYLWLKGGMGSWVEHFRAWDRPFPPPPRAGAVREPAVGAAARAAAGAGDAGARVG